MVHKFGYCFADVFACCSRWNGRQSGASIFSESPIWSLSCVVSLRVLGELEFIRRNIQ
jgi:hypothetical protein